MWFFSRKCNCIISNILFFVECWNYKLILIKLTMVDCLSWYSIRKSDQKKNIIAIYIYMYVHDLYVCVFTLPTETLKKEWPLKSGYWNAIIMVRPNVWMWTLNKTMESILQAAEMWFWSRYLGLTEYQMRKYLIKQA